MSIFFIKAVYESSAAGLSVVVRQPKSEQPRSIRLMDYTISTCDINPTFMSRSFT
jgi:hypothetical protein